MIDLRVVADPHELRTIAAALVAEAIELKPTAAVIPATGATPMATYAELASLSARGELAASALRVFQLDEYGGIGAGDRRSLLGWLLRSFTRPLGIADERVVRLDGDGDDPAAACRRYDRAVEEAGGIDLAILGLGPNGHLGFNEPPSDPASPTRVVDLTTASIASNAAYWGSAAEVPRSAITAGMTVLTAARRTILLVSGAHKHDIVRRAIEGPVTPEVPASWLQQRDGVTAVVDRAAWDGDRGLETGPSRPGPRGRAL